MKVVFLGTNGWYDTAAGNTVCALVETSAAYVVLDAGNGIYKLDSYIKDSRPVYIFLSHLHIDHIAGLHALNKFNFPQGIKIITGAGFNAPLKTILDAPYSKPWHTLRMKVEFTESVEGLAVPMTTFPLTHSVPCQGVRIKDGGKTLAYAPDTGDCPPLRKLAENADLLITECSYRSGEVRPEWPHLNPEIAAAVAAECGAQKLALTHFEAARYPTFAERDSALCAARKIFANAFAPHDGDEMTV